MHIVDYLVQNGSSTCQFSGMEGLPGAPASEARD
jgi:hypothetical protein